MKSNSRILCGDVLRFFKHYHEQLFHAALLDPPYHLTSIVKRFGKEGSKPPTGNGGTKQFVRAASGFMNQTWDGGDIAFRPETWVAMAELLYPGAFIIAFAGSRGWHRQAVAMEDAGLVMHSSIFLWTYGQGFPKATRIKSNDTIWDGYRYGGQALKPATEPILVFQKPYRGRPVDNITETGAGALNIDGTRLPIGDGDDPRLGGKGDWDTAAAAKNVYEGGYAGKCIGSSTLGRWPANLALIHHNECSTDGCHPECPVRRLDEQTGQLTSGKPSGVKKAGNNIYGEYATGIPVTGIGDSGGASRFFFNADWNAEVEERLLEADPLRYVPKASRAERESGLENCKAQKVNDGREKDIDNPYQRGETQRLNTHPTVKPIALNQWLATLLLPPETYAPRRLLVPFAGVGSEIIGAIMAGWDCIIGIEGQQEYVQIA